MLLEEVHRVENITYSDVSQFWERSVERLWSKSYQIWISPNKILRAYTNEDIEEVAIIWNRFSGELLRLDEKALYELIKTLGGWI